MARIGGFEDASRLYETAEGRSFVLPVGRRRSRLLPVAIEGSMPHGWEFGGLVSAGPVRPKDVDAVMADLNRRRLTSVTVQPDPIAAPVWRAASAPRTAAAATHTTHILDLSAGFDYIWSKVWDSSTRTKLRKAEKSGLSVERDVSGKLVPVFYALYEKWMVTRAHERKQPVPLVRWVGHRRDPLKKLQGLANSLGDAFRTSVAWLDGQPVAAAILLVHGAHAHYWRSASDKVLTRQTRANDLLQWRMIEDACGAGCRYYHMGESGGVPSLVHFKTRFGGAPYTSPEYYVERVPVARATRGLQELVLRAGNRRPAADVL